MTRTDRSWHFVAHSSLLERPGEYVAITIGLAEVAVVVGHDGFPRAFENVCLHRPSPILDAEGRCQSVVCLAHGWTYDLDGTLLSPELTGSPRLAPYALQSWRRLFFVNLSDSSRPLATHLASAAVLLADCPIDEMVSTGSATMGIRSPIEQVLAHWPALGVSEGFEPVGHELFLQPHPGYLLLQRILPYRSHRCVVDLRVYSPKNEHDDAAVAARAAFDTVVERALVARLEIEGGP